MRIYVEPTDPEKMLLIGKMLDKRGFMWGNTRTRIFEPSASYIRYFCTRPFEGNLCIEVLPNKRGIYISLKGYTTPIDRISDEQFLQNSQKELIILNGGDL